MVKAEITAVEVKQFHGRKAKGLRLVVEFTSDDGVIYETSHIGCYIPHSNSSQAKERGLLAEKLGRRDIERLCRAVGLDEAFQSYEQLLHKPVCFTVQEESFNNVTKSVPVAKTYAEAS